MFPQLLPEAFAYAGDEIIARGVAHTAPMITAAALIMVISFSALMASQVLVMRLFGFGLTLAVLVDATIVWSAGCEVGAEIGRCRADEEGALPAGQPEDLFGPRHFIENGGATTEFVADLVSRSHGGGRIRPGYVDIQRRQLVEKHVAWLGGCNGCP